MLANHMLNVLKLYLEVVLFWLILLFSKDFLDLLFEFHIFVLIF